MSRNELQCASGENLIARSRIYQLLALGFSFPSREIYACFLDGGYAEQMRSSLVLCVPKLADAEMLDGLRTNAPFENFESLYLSAFETDMPEPSVSLYEGSYVQKGHRTMLLLEIKEFYSNFGLKMASTNNDLEDTLAAELEFMQFLAAKFAQAENEGTKSYPYLLAQHDFLTRHLAVWLPVLQKTVSERVKDQFFVTLTKLADAFVAEEVAAVRHYLGKVKKMVEQGETVQDEFHSALSWLSSKHIRVVGG